MSFSFVLRRSLPRRAGEANQTSTYGNLRVPCGGANTPWGRSYHELLYISSVDLRPTKPAATTAGRDVYRTRLGCSTHRQAMWNRVATWQNNGRVVFGCHAAAGKEYFARWAGVSRQNDYAALCIEPWPRVVPSSVTALQVLHVLGSDPCFRVVGPTYTLLDGEGVREQGLCFHGHTLLPGEGEAKRTGYAEGEWVLGSECAPGLGECTPGQLLGFAISACVGA